MGCVEKDVAVLDAVVEAKNQVADSVSRSFVIFVLGREKKNEIAALFVRHLEVDELTHVLVGVQVGFYDPQKILLKKIVEGREDP